jgi:hypothetical protein
MELYDVSEQQYGWIFGAIAAGLIGCRATRVNLGAPGKHELSISVIENNTLRCIAFLNLANYVN